MKFLGIDENELKKIGGIHTAREIQQQPDVWGKIYNQVNESAQNIKEFIDGALSEVDDIVLSGAGTSAYVGDCLVSEFNKNLGHRTKAIPTTDIVTHPHSFFKSNRKVLLVSFARSGNSPESCATVDLAEQFAEKAYHLIITCNPEGSLVKSGKPHQYNIVLPEETNDVSLAMTSSFSGMLLTGLLISRITTIGNEKKNVDAVVKYARNVLDNFVTSINKIANLDFNRAIFLGSGPLFGTSIESHLKLQELTDGAVICKNESFLAFRHGPKAVIDKKTIVVFILSNDSHSVKYEKDLIETIKNEGVAMALVGISEGSISDLNLDLEIALSDGNTIVDEPYLTLSHIVPSQILGVFKSINLGLKPDNPSISGTITRVVEGVNIYKK